jgi:hypothetical protein
LEGFGYVPTFLIAILVLLTTNAFAGEDGKSSTVSILVVAITGVFGFLGSWLGANLALQSFKRQRAFDKQLDWYERAARAIFLLAEKIQIADTFQSDPDTQAGELKRLWEDVQGAHLKLSWVSYDSRLFASRKA